jgi:integrase/recombinase XerD
MTQIDETIASYLTALGIEGKTPKTIASYANSLEDFRRVGRRLGLPETVEEYGVEQVYQFLGALQERGASPGYQHRRHREVQTLFSWCERMGMVEQNVFKRVPRIKVGERIKPPFSSDEVHLLLDSQDRESLRGCRNYAIILFLLDTGVRATECISIQLEDVDWDRQRVFVRHAKGQKQRWVGIGEVAASALRGYVERFRGEREGMLFLSSYGERLTTGNSLRIILRRIGDAVGLAKVHPHRFRHTFATWAIQSGAREIDVQMLLGHSDLTMTQRYARTYTSEQAVQAHGELSPVAQLEAVSGPTVEDKSQGDEMPATDLLPPRAGGSHVAREGEAKVEPLGDERNMATTKDAMKPGVSLVAKYKGAEYTCEVIDHDGALRFVLPGGERFKSPSAAGRAITAGQVNGYRFWTILEKPSAVGGSH